MKNMDRTSWLGVLVCLCLLYVWGWYNAKETAKQLEAKREREAQEALNPPAEVVEEKTGEPAPATATAAPADDAPEAVAEMVHVLENHLFCYKELE